MAASANAQRREWGFEGKFVVGYSGNLGRAHDFLTIIESKNPGDSVILTVVRDGKETRVAVRLTSSDQLEPQPAPPE